MVSSGLVVPSDRRVEVGSVLLTIRIVWPRQVLSYGYTRLGESPEEDEGVEARLAESSHSQAD